MHGARGDRRLALDRLNSSAEFPVAQLVPTPVRVGGMLRGSQSPRVPDSRTDRGSGPDGWVWASERQLGSEE